MSITLVTGLPGAGKTLYSLVRWKAESETAGRQVFHASGMTVDGIPKLRLPWQVWDAREWPTLPAGSIMLIDEAQRVFPVRPRGAAVPKYVELLETHRHMGLDLVLITQDPMLIDAHVRKLCDRHFHVMRVFGLARAVVHEFPTGVRDNVAKSRSGSTQHTFKYPKAAYAWYQSSELHTMQRRVPAKVWILLLAPLILAALVAVFVMRTKARIDGESPDIPLPGGYVGGVPGVPGAPGRVGAAAAPGGQRVAPLTPGEWAQLQQARVPGLPHTAAVYDQVTVPVVAPYPAACVASAARCLCYTQQATRIDAPDGLCRGIAAGGFFVAWGQPAGVGPGVVPAVAAAGPAGPGFAPALSLGGTPPARLAPASPEAQP